MTTPKSEAEYKIEMDQIIYGSGFGRIVDGKIEHIPIEEVVMTEAERIEESAKEDYKTDGLLGDMLRERFKAGVSWARENPLPHDDTCVFEKALLEAKFKFQLILIPPIEEPKAAHEFKSLWERDKRDALSAIQAIDAEMKEENK